MDKKQQEERRVAEETQSEAEICREVDVCLDYRGNNGWDRIRDFHSCWWGCVETAQSAINHWVTDMVQDEAVCDRTATCFPTDKSMVLAREHNAVDALAGCSHVYLSQY